jgi:3-deoxy-D-manno-octulosonate 8-phosphate phosphatase (KDO 8-P phosphatase)
VSNVNRDSGERPLPSAELLERARRVRLLSCDVDGVLTDGKLYYGDDGSEFRAFSALDGLGLKLLLRSGIAVAWITGSSRPLVIKRAQDLGIVHVAHGSEDKLAPWERLRSELGLEAAACAHIGDDLPDLPLLRRCGLAAAVPQAPEIVRLAAHHVTRASGGAGAVRELCELILAAQGSLDPLLEEYTR